MNYEQLEDAISARLTAKLPNDYRVIVMEDTEAEMARPVTKPQVAVCYLQSDYDRAQSTSHVSQTEQPTFMIMLTCRKRRGELGIYELYDLVCKWLLGWVPPNCTQGIQFRMFQFQMNDKGWFIYSLTVDTKTMVVEDTSEAEGIENALPKSTEIKYE